jgi:hypothetical protein
MQLITQPDLEQVSRLPKSERHIVAFDDDVVVYRAYRPELVILPPHMVILLDNLSSIASVGLSRISCG